MTAVVSVGKTVARMPVVAVAEAVTEAAVPATGIAVADRAVRPAVGVVIIEGGLGVVIIASLIGLIAVSTDAAGQNRRGECRKQTKTEHGKPPVVATDGIGRCWMTASGRRVEPPLKNQGVSGILAPCRLQRGLPRSSRSIADTVRMHRSHRSCSRGSADARGPPFGDRELRIHCAAHAAPRCPGRATSPVTMSA